MEALLSLPFSWRMFSRDRSTAVQNRRLLCESYLVTGQRDLAGLKPDLPLRLKHRYDPETTLHRFAVYQKKRLLGYLPLPEAQKLAAYPVSGQALYARISWYDLKAPFQEKLRIRISG